MGDVIEIETTVTDDVRREWIGVERQDAPNGEAWISMHRLFEGFDGARRTDPEAGLCFDAAKLDEIIAALTRLRDGGPSDSGSDHAAGSGSSSPSGV